MTQQPIPKEDAKAAWHFMNNYRMLVGKYGFAIDSCGCCDSPWLVKVTPFHLEPEPGSDDKKSEMERYFQQIEKSIPSNEN